MILTQVINTIQGEGINIGLPMTLVRFGNCNLTCPFCDTKWANNINDKNIKEKQVIKNNLLFPQIINNDNKEKYYNYINEKCLKTKRLMFTGGEPFLNQEEIHEIIEFISKNMDIKHIEYETNGTIFPDLLKVLNPDITSTLFNISSKLNPRYFQEPINERKMMDLYYENNTKYIQNGLNFVWKFVYEPKLKDLLESILYGLLTDINYDFSEKILIMPLTPDIHDKEYAKKYKENYEETLKFCMGCNVRFSPRLQTLLFDINNRDEYENL